MSKPTIKVTSDFTKNFNSIVRQFKNDAVLVGIPNSNKNKREDTEESINNATILAINELRFSFVQ